MQMQDFKAREPKARDQALRPKTWLTTIVSQGTLFARAHCIAGHNLKIVCQVTIYKTVPQGTIFQDCNLRHNLVQIVSQGTILQNSDLGHNPTKQ